MTRSERRSRGGAVLAAAAMLAMLAGCADQDVPTYTDYDTADEQVQDVPADLDAGGYIDPDSIRLAGSIDGVTVYRAAAVDGPGNCVVVVVDSEDGAVSGCGDRISKQNDWTVQIHPDDDPPEDATGDGWTQFGRNVSLRTG